MNAAGVLRAWRVRLRRLARGSTRPLRQVEPEAWRNVGAELGAGRLWVDRAVVLGYAGATGALVVACTYLAEGAHHLFEQLGQATPLGLWIMLAWTPLLTMALMWWTRRFAPGAGGSGIPQVMRAVDDETLTPREVSSLVSLKLSFQKIVLVAGGVLGGLSIGREGPTVQIGAGVMLHGRRWLSSRSTIDGHDLMVAGAAAGIAAAFNTPLGGIVFALEKLSRRRGISHSALVISCIVLAGLVSVSVFGNVTYFGQLSVQTVSMSMLGPGVAIALVTGVLGGIFSRLLVVSAQGLPDRFSRYRRQHPLRFAGFCGLGVAVIGVVTGGATAGAGYGATHALLEGQDSAPPLFSLLKFVATWLSAWSGVPAGVFAPSLTIGAGIGHDVAQLAGVSQTDKIPLIALGMVGFLSAATQGPITAFILVMEMVAGHTMVLSLMACSLVASGVSRLIARPLYPELALLLLPDRTPPPRTP